MADYKKYSTKQYEQFLRQPFKKNFGISKKTIAEYIGNPEGHSDAFVTNILDFYGLTPENLEKTYIPIIEDKLGGYVVFLLVAMAEGGGAGNWINHFGENTGGSATADLKDDLDYVLSTLDKSKPVVYTAPEVGVDYVEDNKGQTQKAFDALPKNSIGAYYMTSTMAGNAWVFGHEWTKENFNNETNNVYFGNPYDTLIDAIKEMGGSDPFKHEDDKPKPKPEPKPDHGARLIAVRDGGKWDERSMENYATVKEVNKGQNRVRVNNEWRQAPKMKGDDVDE